MPQLYLETKIKQIYLGGDIKKAYIGSQLFFSRSQPVTYYIDEDNMEEEEVEYGATCLDPKTFTPQKSGYTFLGWRNSATLPTTDKDVLSEKVMGNTPLKLYATFKKTITCTFKSYNTSKKVSGTVYYNNGKIKPATITTPAGASYSGWDWRGWSDDEVTDSDANVFKKTGEKIENMSSGTSRTYYGLYKQNITQTFKGVANTSDESKTVTRYLSSSDEGVKNPTVTLPNAKKYSDWTFLGWSGANKTDGDATPLEDGAENPSRTVTKNNTYYALYSKKITVSFKGNGSTGGSTSSLTPTINRSASGNYANNKITLPSCGFTKRSHTFSKWAIGSTSGNKYSKGSSVSVKDSTSFYAIWTENSYTYIMNNNPDWNKTKATKNVKLNSGATYWSIGEGGYITFYVPTTVDFKNLSKILIKFNQSRDDDGKVQLKVYLPSSSGFTDEDTNKILSNEIKDTGYIDAGTAQTLEIDIPTTVTGSRYITIAPTKISNNANATLTLWQVAYK